MTKENEAYDPCVWIGDESSYDTACGNSFCIENGATLEENNFKYCIYCGRQIQDGLVVVNKEMYEGFGFGV